MDETYKHLMWMKNINLETIRKLKIESCALPKEKLTIKRNKDHDYYYISVAGKQKMIKNSDRKLKAQYARKIFVDKLLKMYEKNLLAIEIMESHYTPISVDKLIEELKKKYKNIPEEDFLKSNHGIKQSENRYREESLQHKTDSGIYVRSKSEVVIANILWAKKLEFYYEKEIRLSGQKRYPDFTIVHPLTGELIYWEHFGLVGNEIYESDMDSKLLLYRENGITPWNNLITTYDTPEGQINSMKIRKILEMFVE